MAFKLNHLHIKTPNPKETVTWYVDNLGASITETTAAGTHRLDLHGLPLNVTPLIDGQIHTQNYGIEHIAIETDDIDATVANLESSDAKNLEEISTHDGRKVCFFEGPQGVLFEIIEVKG
jgi:catechol 2,3-dioxygenase-like lactoylglutathione lyase family enzyme